MNAREVLLKKRDGGVRSPACVYSELDLVLKSARDLFTDDIEKIVVEPEVARHGTVVERTRQRRNEIHLARRPALEKAAARNLHHHRPRHPRHPPRRRR